MKGYLRSIAIALVTLQVLGSIHSASAGPFADFFKELRSSFRDTNERPRPHRTVTHHQTDQRTTSDVSPRKTAKTSSPPNERNTRSASRASKSSTGDLKYGTPVPGKKGFVTSPFSSDAGYIDVRGFPPGTPVKDPYSGKTFLTP